MVLEKAVKAFSATKLEITTSSYHHLLLSCNSPAGKTMPGKVVVKTQYFKQKRTGKEEQRLNASKEES